MQAAGEAQDSKSRLQDPNQDSSLLGCIEGITRWHQLQILKRLSIHRKRRTDLLRSKLL